jgi:Arc/MetJ family transcription regulator
MKTTLDIDEDLLKQAKEALSATTIKETVRASLEAVVRQRKLKDLADAFGSISFDMSPEELRTQRRKRGAHGPR